MNKSNKQALLYGSITAVLMLIYLAIMTAISQVHNFNLRIFNLVIIGFGVFFAIKNYLKVNNTDSNYMTGLSVGALTSLYTALFFSIIASTILLSNEAFIQEIRRVEPQGKYLNHVSLTAITFIETLLVGLLTSFASMQLLKNDKPMSITENQEKDLSRD